MEVEQEFKTAVKYIQNLPKSGPFNPPVSTKLKFYGWFKQATEGQCNIPQPPFYSPTARLKWEAWKSLGDMSREEAMRRYLKEYDIILQKFKDIAPAM